ncbi:hypothetical protein L6164_033265 [Bauhinia variegata]|uniref:Uncharacterized protein n=1 Tax=Bauhinia variegata TaxID=167791 RepID=A0ACB9KRF4_BAUVA|nr:hypothetical protein L6164_033265 [Bauhinia variegata]
MNMSPVSLTRQLTEAKERFSYCLIEKSPSLLRFGDDAGFGGKPYQKIPIRPIPPTQGNTYQYNVNLIDISVGDNRSGFPPGTFSSPSGNTILDSGTYYAYMKCGPYEVVMKKFDDYYTYIGLPPVRTPHGRFEHCYRIDKNFRDFLPMTYHFEGGAKLKINPPTLYYKVKGDFALPYCQLIVMPL